jgi:hypothetical protein
VAVTLRASLSSSSRRALCVWAAFSAFSFAWAAWVLPSRPVTPLAGLAAVLTCLHAATSVSAGCAPARLAVIWRVAAFASLGAALIFAAAILWSSVAVIRLYGSLGWGLTALLVPILLLLSIATVPFGICGLRATRTAYERP